jgi:exodeoxyribonuclease V alpha subunit
MGAGAPLGIGASGERCTVRLVPVTFTGEVERVTFENEETGFRVLRVGRLEGEVKGARQLTVVGVFTAVGPGTRVRVVGDLALDARHGQQFRAESLVVLEPDTLEGLEKYLGSGIVPGIGAGFARRIVEKFGLQTLTVLDHHCGRLAEVSGLGERRAAEIGAAWAAKRAMSSVMIILQQHGASPKLASRVWEMYGSRAAEVVQRSPYRLALDIRGVGFKTADRLARSLGLGVDHPERAQAGVWHLLGGLADSGHTVTSRGELVGRGAEFLGVEPEHVEAAVDVLWSSGRVTVDDLGVSLTWLAAAEQVLASGLLRLTERPTRALPAVSEHLAGFERSAGVKLAAQQIRAIELAAASGVCVITGGPGVGKTTIIRAVLSVLSGAGLQVRLAAPTGRAAKRMAEATGHEATTLHRLLEFEPRSGKFQRDASQPLATDAVIVDEASMIDVALGAALIAALPDSARLVVVGDADQLPSVGPGALLRDVIGSGRVPFVRLDEIFRQNDSSRIVANAHRILSGEELLGADSADPAADFFVVRPRDADHAAVLVEELVVRRIPKRFGLNPVGDVQVLTPMHRGPVGTIALNAQLQAALNPGATGLVVGDQEFREGDKVMQNRNDHEREVFNGDVGRVVSVDRGHRQLTVDIDGRLVSYGDAELEQLGLAYCTSIHKSQGSEYPAVVVPLLTSHYVMLARNLLYTAVTRARKLCVLVAEPRALSLALSEARREERRTRLDALLSLAGEP